MSTLFTEIEDSQASILVGGRSIKSDRFLSVNAEARAKSLAETSFIDTGYPQTYSATFTNLDDLFSSSESVSLASIFYSDSPI